MAAIGRVLLMDKGAYSGSTIYNQLDWVRDNGASWVCKVDGTVGIAPPTLPTTSNANWTLLAADGSVSGSVAWSAVTGKPFDSVKSGGGIDVNVSNELELDTSYLTGSNISYDNTGSGATSTNVQDALDELFAGGGGGGLSNAFDEVEVNGISLIASGGDALHLLAGSNISLTPNASTKTVKIDATGGGSGGHTMIPNNTAITSLTAKATDSTDDDVASGYAIANWSNAEITTLIAHIDSGDDTVGAWNDAWKTDGIRTGWVWHECLYDIVSDNEVEISIDFDVAGEEVVGLYAYRVDDNVQNGGVDGGAIAIKLTSPIQNPLGVDVAINLKRQRTNLVTNPTILS